MPSNNRNNGGRDSDGVYHLYIADSNLYISNEDDAFSVKGQRWRYETILSIKGVSDSSG